LLGVVLFQVTGQEFKESFFSLVGFASGLGGTLLLHLVVNVEEAETGEDQGDEEEYYLESHITSLVKLSLSLRGYLTGRGGRGFGDNRSSSTGHNGSGSLLRSSSLLNLGLDSLCNVYLDGRNGLLLGNNDFLNGFDLVVRPGFLVNG